MHSIKKHSLNSFTLLFLCLLFFSVQADVKSSYDIETGNIDYRLNVTTYEEKGKEYVKSIGLQGRSGKNYSKRGWYHSGFIFITVNGKSLFDNPVETTKGEKDIVLNFKREKENDKLIFNTSVQSDKLFCTLDLSQPSKSISVILVAYPGDFNKHDTSLNQRCISTSNREIDTPQATVLNQNEAWVYYFDRKNNPAGKPHLSNCAMLYNPRQTSKVTINTLANYAVKTQLTYKPGLKKIYFIFWEFPGMDYRKGLKYLNELEIEFKTNK